MLTESVLNNFKTISESIHLPHGTKSAKLVCHVDLDGVTSGITMVHQLVKQGIPKERITVEFAQYGDEDKEKSKHTQKFIGKKNEFVGVTDFAKLPKIKIFDIWNKLYAFHGSPSALLNILQRNFNTVEELKKSIPEVPKVTQWTEENIKNIFDGVRAYNSLKKASQRNKSIEFEEATIDNIKTLKFPLVTPDFVSDHHSNEQGSLSGGLSGGIAIDSPSELEHMAQKYAPGMWSDDDIKAISMVDSAGYTEEQLKNTVFLDKHFTGPDKKKNLATIVACIYDNLCKKDRNAAAWIIKNSQPSLVSLYTNTLQAAKYNGKRLEYVSALKTGDVAKAKQLLSEIPGELNKRYDRRGDPKQPIMNHAQWQEKNRKDMENMKTGYKTEADEKALEAVKGQRSKEARDLRDSVKNKKGKIVMHNNFAIFNGKENKVQYTRYATTLYSKNGQRAAFSMRYWNGFFQIAKSTLYKGTVNFADVNEHVLQDIRSFLMKEGYGEFNTNRVIEGMKEQNGGHSGGIWSFQGFDAIKAPSKVTDDKYWKAYNHKKNHPDSEIANKIISRKQPEIDRYNDMRERCMKFAMNSAVHWTNKLYPVSQENLDALKTNDKDFDEA